MISYYTIVTILFIHWFCDFFLQSDEQAKGKSKENYWLNQHVFVYAIGIGTMAVLNSKLFADGENLRVAAIVGWTLLNIFLHWLTDYVTSRASSLLFEKQNFHDAFVVIGGDQFIHYFTLFGTLIWMTNH